MRQCPECDRVFDDGLDACPDDGARLMRPDPLVGREIEQKYRIDALVGRGGMGAVYRATQTRLDRAVAVKVIRPDCVAGEVTVERFRREALALARIKHPNIVVVHDFGVDAAAGVYLVMEMLGGRSLADEIGRHGQLAPEVALDLMAQVCSAVHAAHAEGVIHRDLKPANILVEPLGAKLVAKVLDFGVVRLQEQERGAPELTADGAILGTPSYMSPEQCEGDPLDARSDVYSLGCVLYEALTGRPPFRAPSMLAVLQKHAFEPPRPPSAHRPELSPEVDALVLGALAKRPEDRYQSALDFQQRVEAVAAALARSRGGMVAAAPPAAPRTAAGNLPQPMTSFVGRERDIAAVRERLATARLVTLRGIGGIGKTRLAVEAARAAGGDFEDGSWLVELAPVKDPSLVAQALARALGVREAPGRPLLAGVADALRGRRLLLVLDNCEHLVAACADVVAGLLAECPRLTVLATSRESLGVAGEVIWHVAPLSLPRAGEDPDEHAGAESVRLFLDRVRLHNPRFEPVGARGAAIAAVCERLEGIPLAIELAAARARVLSVEQIVARLDDRFQLLRGSDRPSMHRQQTLRAAIDWSYDLLSDEERILLARLAVFVGGCSLEAAEEVCSGDAVATNEVLDLLARLADKSLVQVDERDGEARYWMLETIRQYGLERLRAAGDEAEVLARHRAWFLQLAREAESHYRTPSEPEWLARLERDQDNFRAVLRRFAREGGDPAAAVELASCLGRFWELKGLVQEALEWADVLLPHEAELADPVRARYLESVGWLNKLGGRLAVSKELLVRATDMWQGVGGRLGEARSLAALAGTLQLMGEFDAAWEAGTRSLELFEAEGFGPGMQSALNQLGLMASDGGDPQTARMWYERCLEVARERGDKRALGITLHNLAMVAWFVGDLTRAEAQLAEALVHVAEIGDRAIEARSWIVAASIAIDRLNPERAVECLRQALTGGAEIGDVVTIVNGLEQAARAFVQLARPRDALRLVGAAAAGREALTIVLPAAYHEVIVARTVTRAREELGDEEADRALAEGRATSLEEAIGLACA